MAIGVENNKNQEGYNACGTTSRSKE